ncbi:MAG: hypothetical protein ABIN48_01265, partial [Ginsengibacter sp.]
MNRKITLRSLTTAILFLFFAFPSWGQIIYFHDFETGTISGKHYSGAPATLASNLLNSSWTTSYDNGFTSYSGKSGQALGLGSINGNRIINLTFDVAPGYTCNITSFNFWRQRSNTAPETITMTINGKSVGEVPNTPTSGSNIGTTNIVDFNNLTGTVAIQLSLTGTGGTFRIDDFTLNGFLVFTGVESQQSGYWNDGSTWVGGIVPNLNQTVLINEGHIVHVDGTGIPTRNANTYINGTFQLNTGGWIGGSNQFIYGSNGTLNFNTNGEYGVEANHIYWPSDNGPVHVNVLQGGTDLTGGLLLNNLSRIINGSLNLWSGVRFENGGLIQINGTCQINQGGWVSSPLTYGPNSTLIYNTNTDPYRNGNEWTPTSNPTNVILNGNTILNYPVIGPEERSISGSLTIEAGSALYMDYDSVNVNSLTIGDLFLSGNLSLGTNPGGDLKTTGNLHFSPGSNFNSNNRAIFFIKDGIQTINNTSATSLTIPYMVIGKTGGSGTTVQMNADVSISAPNTGNALSFINASDVLDMNHRSLTIGTMGTDNQIIGPGSFRGSQTSKLILTGNGDIGTIRFSGTQELGNLTINRTINLPAVTMGSSLTIHNNLTLTNGHITLGANNFQIQPAATITGGGVNSYIRANGTGKLIRYFNTKNQPINLPVGGLQYSPVNYEITEGNLVNNATFLSINLAENKHTQNNSSTSYLNRFWNVSVAGLTTYKADAQFYYNPADVTGTEANILSAAYDGALWQMDHPANTTNHFLSFTETDDLNRAFTGGNQFAPLASHRSNYFRSRSSGDWTTSGTWESSYDNGVWFNATFYPTALANNILIRNTHTVTLNQATTVKRLTIESGGTLTNSGPSGGFDLTIAGDGTSDPAFKIYGTYLLFGKQPVFQPSATARVYANGLVRADDNNGGQSENFASNTNVMFESNAVFEWNIEKPFKTSGVTYFPNSLPTDIPVFKVSKNPGSVGTGILTINGILNVNTDFTFIGGSNKTFRNGIVGNSTLTQNSTGGNRFTINGSNAILGGNNLRINLSNQMYLESSVTVLKDSIVAISGATLNNNTVGNIFSIEGTLDVTDITITNTTGKTITVAKTGTYRTAHPGGFSGGGSSIPSTDGIVSLQPGSTVEFYRNGNQDFDKRDDFSNLIFSGSGIKRASSGFVPVGTITIKENAILDSRGRNIGNSQTNLTMTDNSRFIVSSTGRNPEIDGVYNLLGGVIQFDNSSGTKQTIRGTTSLPAAGSPVVYNQIEVTGTNVGIGSGNINLRDGGKFTVKSGGVFEVNQRAIKGEPG